MGAAIIQKAGEGIYLLSNRKFRVKAAWGDRTRGGLQREKTFPEGTSIKLMKRWRDDAIADMRRQSLIPVRGTLSGDIPRYLALVETTIENPTNRRYEIDAWCQRFGSRPRHLIKNTDVEQQVQDWLTQKVAASTIRHRLTALSRMYQLLDGREAFNPVRGVQRPREPEPEARNVAPQIIHRVFSVWARSLGASHKGTKTLVRCKVLYWTGMRPSQLMRVVTSTDVEPYLGQDPPSMVIRKAGKRGKTHTKPLNESGVNAWREFIAVGAQGKFSTSSMWKSWTLACKRAGVEPFNPYRLRHSYASDLRRGGADLADIQDILGHTSPKTTQRYAAPSDEKLTDLVRKLDRVRHQVS